MRVGRQSEKGLRVWVTATLIIGHMTGAGLLSLGCDSSSGESGSSADSDAESDVGVGAGDAAIDATGSAEVSFETDDGVTLVADYYPAAADSRPAVVLFHQTPVSFDRTSFPPRVIEALAAGDRHVLNVDRRGAGDSGGAAIDAFEGEGGRLDVEAAVAFLLAAERSPAVDPEHIVLLGASNGTTSVLDYTLGRTDASLPAPAALIMMSPGEYTENQFEIDDHRELLDQVPILWHFPDTEGWSLALEDGAPSSWRFVELEGGRHGTANFDDAAREEATVPELVSWVQMWSP